MDGCTAAKTESVGKEKSNEKLRGWMILNVTVVVPTQKVSEKRGLRDEHGSSNVERRQEAEKALY